MIEATRKEHFHKEIMQEMGEMGLLGTIQHMMSQQMDFFEYICNYIKRSHLCLQIFEFPKTDFLTN